jgi:dihydropteroate synthase
MVALSDIRFRHTVLTWDRTYVMAVLNVTPDSFSDGGKYAEPASAIEFGLRAVDAGADLLDIGGESTRPRGAVAVSAAEEIERVIPVIRALVPRVKVPISVDTTKAEVARAAAEVGAEIVNDISGGLFDPQMFEVVAQTGLAYVCGHVRGRTLAEVHQAPPPGFDGVAAELAERVRALPAPVRARTLVDPGLGFGKGTKENVELLARAGELGAGLGRPVLVGPSRKRFLGELCGRPVDDRDDATVGACLAAAAAGADVVRVHDVKRVKDALSVFEAVLRRERACRERT